MIKQISTILMLALAALCFTGVASAQDNEGATAQQQQARQLMQEYRQKAARLQAIHAQTIKANPDLAQQQAEFMTMVRGAVEDNGYDIEKGQERVQALAAKLKGGDLSQEERQAVMQDFAAERRALQQARAAALQQPEVQAAGEQLQKDTLAAMKAQSDETGPLMEDMRALRAKLRAAMPAPGGG